MWPSGIMRAFALGLLVSAPAWSADRREPPAYGDTPSFVHRDPASLHTPAAGSGPWQPGGGAGDLGVADATRVTVESPAVSFGEVLGGEAAIQAGSVVVRVISPQPWMLRLVPLSELERYAGEEPLPLTRLSWRGGMAGGFVPFEGRQPVTVAEGPPTGSGGRLVILDLKLELTDADPTGEYFCGLRVQVEPY